MTRSHFNPLTTVIRLWGVCVAVVICAGVPRAVAQQVVVNGTVFNASSQAPVPRATVQVERSFRGTTTNADGRYQLELDAETERTQWTLTARALGYNSKTTQVSAREGDTLHVDFELKKDVVQLGTVTVSARSNEDTPSTYRLNPRSIKNAPALGEPDVIRTAAFLPGITQSNDYKAAINVRGGAADQNQFLLDGFEVYNPNHLFGALGPFNVAALQEVTVHAAEFPVNYGGRLSSVIAMQSRRPPDTTFARANVSLLSANLVGSRSFGKSGVTLAARRTYADPLLALAGAGFWYNFHDVTTSVTHDFGDGWTGEALGFHSRDALSPRSNDDSSLPRVDLTWGGYVGGVRLRHDGNTFQHAVSASVQLKSLSAAFQQEGEAYFDNRFRERTAAYDGKWNADAVVLEGGVEAQHQSIRHGWRESGDFQVDEVLYDEAPPTYDGQDTRFLFVTYASLRGRWGRRWEYEAGLRYTVPTLEERALEQSTPAPRLQLSFQATEDLTWTATAGVYTQHVAVGEEGRERTVDEPTFLLRTPQVARTSTLGAVWDGMSGVRLGFTGYLRGYEDVARLVDGRNATYPQFQRRAGRTWGIDVFARKSTGWLTGQLSYSYTNTRLKADASAFSPDWSVPHTVQGLVGVQLGNHWKLQVAGTWRSGLPFTPLKGSFRAPVFDASQLDERFVEAARNSARLPAYARTDVSLRRTYQADAFDWTLYVQVLNVFNRTNPQRVDDPRLLYRSERPGLPSGVAGSLPIVPSLGVEFQF